MMTYTLENADEIDRVFSMTFGETIHRKRHERDIVIDDQTARVSRAVALEIGSSSVLHE